MMPTLMGKALREELLARAAAHEFKAKALRMVVEEMNGHQRAGKSASAEALIDQAATARGENGDAMSPTGRAKRTVPPPGAREQAVREFLESSGAPQSSEAVRLRLLNLGIGCSQSYTLKVLREIGAHLDGNGHQSRWSLGPQKKARAAPGSRLQAKQALYDKTVKVLGAYDTKKPMRPADVARVLGLASVAKTGFGPLVNSGYLKKKGDGYIRTAKAYPERPAADAVK